MAGMGDGNWGQTRLSLFFLVRDQLILPLLISDIDKARNECTAALLLHYGSASRLDFASFDRPDRLVTASGPLRVRRIFYYLLPYQVVVEAVGSTDLDCPTVSARQQNALCTRYISCIR